MNRLTSWTMIATCAIVAVAGLSVSPAKAQDVRKDRQDSRQDTRDIRSDKQDIGKDTQSIQQDRTALRGARQQLRDAYKSGDPNAVKAARENRRRFTGTIKGLEGEAVVLDTGEQTVSLPLAEIERGKLVLTDALLKSAKPANA